MLIMFDIDGTIADINHRLHHIKTKPKSWKTFVTEIPNDSVITPVAVILKKFGQDASNHSVILATGREEAQRAATEEWLAKNYLNWYKKLYMRNKGDYREDTIVKEEMLEKILNDWGQLPDLVFEDRPRVVAMWKRRGIFTCCVNQSDEDF